MHVLNWFSSQESRRNLGTVDFSKVLRNISHDLQTTVAEALQIFVIYKTITSLL